jgi:hypothetical protein
MFKNTSEGRRSVGRPRMRWLDEIENYLRKWALKGPEEDS